MEIGTGYFVKKSVADAKEYIGRKMEFLRTQITVIGGKLDEELRNLEQVSLVIRQKGGQI